MEYPNLYAYRLLKHGNELNSVKKRMFIERVNELFKSDAQVIYRGESKNKLLNLYTSGGLDEFNYKFFIVGPKGKHFLQKAKSRFKISDSKESLFEFIFNALNMMFTDRSTSRLKSQIEAFKKSNKVLTQFFLNLDKRKEFLKKTAGLNKEEKIKVRDYYLTLLHHNGDTEYYKNSFHISLTKSFKKAKEFAGCRETEKKDKIILFGWVPQNRKLDVTNQLSYANRERHLNHILVLKKYDFPTYSKPLFPRQHEVTLKGGLLVTNLVGYLHLENETQDFHINPQFLEQKDNWIQEGLDVDQSEFGAIIRDTLLESAFIVYPTGEMYEAYKRN